jgi:hypothetical protein
VSDLGFTCTGVTADPYAAGPTLVFRLRVTASSGERVHAIALRCQIRIEPALRRYAPAEAGRLGDLFGEPSRWSRSMQPLQFAHVSVMVPGFTGETEVDLPVPCTYDMDIAATKYFEALRDGEAPLTLLFSGTAFRGRGGFQVQPVPWDREAPCRMPARVWREMIDQHFPGCGWLRLPRDTMDELLAFRSRHALPSWQETVTTLLAAAEPTPPAGGARVPVAPSPAVAESVAAEPVAAEPVAAEPAAAEPAAVEPAAAESTAPAATPPPGEARVPVASSPAPAPAPATATATAAAPVTATATATSPEVRVTAP